MILYARSHEAFFSLPNSACETGQREMFVFLILGYACVSLRGGVAFPLFFSLFIFFFLFSFSQDVCYGRLETAQDTFRE